MEQAPKPTEAPQAKGKKTWVIVAAAVIIVVVAVAGLYFAGYLGMQTAGTPVSIFETSLGSCGTATNCNYNPVSLPVALNTKVTWTNSGQLTHTVTTNSTASPAPPAAFDSGSLLQGQQFSHTFTVAGTYKYYCTIHSTFMKAEVIVT